MLPFAVPESERYPLVLAPSDSSGWFRGTTLVAADPVLRESGVSLANAADALEGAFIDRPTEGRGSGLTAALIGYDGTAEVRVYDRFDIADAPASSLAAGAARHAAVNGSLLGGPVFDMDEAGWVRRVIQAQGMIRAGDVYVLNLTMRVVGRALVSPADAFEALCMRAAAPMAALWGAPGASVVSASPERFLSVSRAANGRRVEVWPIKGTAPRQLDPALDRSAADDLAACEKERAEHVMIVDMERNDLGRVCRPGSIRVEPLMEVFGTPYCHQMVSRVSGEMWPNASFAALLDATFPCGSVTGAPKIAAMRAIESLETGPRGAYTGTLIVAAPGRMDSSVLIRTLEYRLDGTAVWGTGCGITIDSDPVAEWQEALLKASPVLG